MFKSLRSDFNLTQLVTFIAALWLQVTVLVILCCASSPQMSAPPSQVDKLHIMAVNGAYAVDAHAVAAAMAASSV